MTLPEYIAVIVLLALISYIVGYTEGQGDK